MKHYKIDGHRWPQVASNSLLRWNFRRFYDSHRGFHRMAERLTRPEVELSLELAARPELFHMPHTTHTHPKPQQKHNQI